MPSVHVVLADLHVQLAQQVSLTVFAGVRLLKGGGYVRVWFNKEGTYYLLHLPTSALLFRQDGMMVAAIGKDDKVELRSVTLGRDLGTQVEVLSGVGATDRIIDIPPDSIAAGDKVRLQTAHS